MSVLDTNPEAFESLRRLAYRTSNTTATGNRIVAHKVKQNVQNCPIKNLWINGSSSVLPWQDFQWDETPRCQRKKEQCPTESVPQDSYSRRIMTQIHLINTNIESFGWVTCFCATDKCVIFSASVAVGNWLMEKVGSTMCTCFKSHDSFHDHPSLFSLSCQDYSHGSDNKWGTSKLRTVAERLCYKGYK